MKTIYSFKLDGAKQSTLTNGQRSKYFKIGEFRNLNHNIDAIDYDDRTGTLLELARIEFGLPIFIAVANRNEPQASYHNPQWKDSCACDIDIGDTGIGLMDYETACRFFEKSGAKGLGRYDYVDSYGTRIKFIHIDARGGEKSFWRCDSVDSKGNQILKSINTFLLPYPVPTRNLKWIQRIWIFRMKGSDVKWLQAALNMTKLSKDISVDGDFGQATDQYVRIFQKNYKLVVDGIAGINTINKLKEVNYI